MNNENNGIIPCNTYSPDERNIEKNDYDAKRAEEQLKNKSEFVFKYKSISSGEDLKRVCDIFQNKRIYMPTLDQLNDPLEAACSIWLGLEETKKKELEDYRVLSLSTDPLLSTMWAHYANNYKGICIGFKTNNKFCNIEKVTYHNDQSAIEWEFSSECLFKKRTAWEHEKEYRIIRKSKDNEFLQFDDGDLACVIMGCHMDAIVREYIESFIPKGIPVFVIKSDTKNFRLYAEGTQRVYTIEDMIKKPKPNTVFS